MGRRESWKTLTTVRLRPMLTGRGCKGRWKERRAAMREVRRYTPGCFSTISFKCICLLLFTLLTLHFHTLLCLFVFLSILHLSFTLPWPCLSHSDLLHLYTITQGAGKKETSKMWLMWRERGSLGITMNPAVHKLFQSVFIIHWAFKKTESTEV